MINAQHETETIDNEKIYTIVDEMPSFPGGEIQMIKFLKKNLKYPMPIHAHDKDDTFVGRIRRDESQANTLNCWIVSDNLRKGAATNAVQIAEYLRSKNFI